MAYARHYMLVNLKNYFLPPLEKLEIYNLGLDEVSPIAAYWFEFGTVKIAAVSKTLQGILLLIFPALFLVLNAYYGWSLFLLVRRKQLSSSAPGFKPAILMVSLFLLLNCCFSVFANIIVIRYQVFPMIIFLAFGMLLTDRLELANGYGKIALPGGKLASEDEFQGSNDMAPTIH